MTDDTTTVQDLHPASTRTVISTNPLCVVIAPDLGRISFNLNKMTPSVMLAIRTALTATLGDPDSLEEVEEMNRTLEQLDFAIDCSGIKT